MIDSMQSHELYLCTLQAGSFNENCDSEVDTGISDRIILNQCLSPCLRQPNNITCSGAVCV